MSSKDIKTVEEQELSRLLKCKVRKSVGKSNVYPIVLLIFLVEERVLEN